MNTDEANLIITKDYVPPAAFAAIHHKITGKTEKFSKVADGRFEVKSLDIVHFDNIIEQVLAQYNVRALNSECTVSLHKSATYNFSDFKKFYSHNFIDPEPTEEFVYTANVLIVLPAPIPEAKDIIQRFKLVLTIDQDFVEDNEYYGEDILYISKWTGGNISLVVEYSDYSVARTLISAFDDWVKSIPVRHSPQWLRIIDNNNEFILSFLQFMLVIPLVIGMLIGQDVGLFDFSSGPKAYIPKIMLATLISYLVGKLLSTALIRRITAFRPLTYIEITRGDIDRKVRVEKNISTSKRTMAYLATAVLLSTLVNLFSSAIWDYVSK